MLATTRQGLILIFVILGKLAQEEFVMDRNICVLTLDANNSIGLKLELGQKSCRLVKADMILSLFVTKRGLLGLVQIPIQLLLVINFVILLKAEASDRYDTCH